METTPALNWDSTTLPKLHPCEGPRIDGSKVRFWAFKKEAAAAAKAIGWPLTSLTPAHTRFCTGWAICQTNGGLVSREEYGAMFEDANPEAGA